MLRTLAAAACLALPAVTASAQDPGPMPQTLVIGYEDEGKIDASPAACRAFVKDMVEWSKPEEDQAVKDVCSYRRKHIDAYESLQAAYSRFRAALSEQTRFDGAPCGGARQELHRHEVGALDRRAQYRHRHGAELHRRRMPRSGPGAHRKRDRRADAGRQLPERRRMSALDPGAAHR